MVGRNNEESTGQLNADVIDSNEVMLSTHVDGDVEVILYYKGLKKKKN